MAQFITQNRTEKPQGSTKRDTVSTWIQDIDMLNSQSQSDGSVSIAGAADESDTADEDVEAEDDGSTFKNERWTEYSLAPEVFHAIVSGSLPRPSPPFQGGSANLSIDHLSSPTSQSHPLVSSHISRSSVPQRSLTPWLEELVDNTLSGQVDSDIFDEGAAGRTSLRDPCPLCFQPLEIEPERSLHLIKCKYAHEERGRLENWMLKEMERRR